MKTEKLQQQLADAQATVHTYEEEIAETNRGQLAMMMELEKLKTGALQSAIFNSANFSVFMKSSFLPQLQWRRLLLWPATARTLGQGMGLADPLGRENPSSPSVFAIRLNEAQVHGRVARDVP